MGESFWPSVLKQLFEVLWLNFDTSHSLRATIGSGNCKDAIPTVPGGLPMGSLLVV